MGRKDTKAAKAAKHARGVAKSRKAEKKADAKNKKLSAKHGDEEGIDMDELLEEFARRQAAFEKVTITVVDRPSKRQGVTMVASPTHGKNELFMFGGESVEGGYSKFFNDMFVYSLDNDIWRKITSPNSPMPRSGHAMCAHPSGIILVFGGEFSSPKQSTFYHYGDTWIFDTQEKDWTKIECRNTPIARSGHRMTVWKNYILMHGGFRDLATSTTYLSDLWAFDIRDYKWHQLNFPQFLSIPDARSGHSLLPCPEGAVLWGGYSKVKATKNGQQVGKVHQDAWMLHMKPDLKDVKWERRKKPTYAPSPRIGCYMVPHQGRGVLFGGVYDLKETEESLESTFYNTLHAYSIEGNRWFTLSLRAPRKRTQGPVTARQTAASKNEDDLQQNLSQILKTLNINVDEMLESDEEDGDVERRPPKAESGDEEDQVSKKEYEVVGQLPHPRFNSALAVVNDQLFIFGGLWEDQHDREYAFDSFYSIDLGKLDGLTKYWEDLGLDKPIGSDDEESDEDDDEQEPGYEEEELEAYVPDSEDEEEVKEEEEADPDQRPWLPHPKPFETLHQFYKGNVEAFVEWALKQAPKARGKDLRRHAFELAESRFWERREALRTAEDQFDEMGGVDTVIERTQARTTRR